MDSKISLAKEARREAQTIIRSQRLEQTKTGIEKMKRQMGLLEVEIDSLHMPIVDEFKVILLKQRANAFRRTVQGQVDRTVNMEIMLPEISKKVTQRRRRQGSQL